MTTMRLILALIIAALAYTGTDGAGAPAPAPASSKSSPCSLPNGQVIVAPEPAGTASQYITYYYTYSWSYYSYYYYSYYYGRKLLQASAPAPSSAKACCPPTTVRSGDTVSSLISGAGLPAESKPFFYTLNTGTVANGTETLPPGSSVTLPCYRITEYQRLQAANAQSPTSTAG
jgi:hypothetical protein